MPLASANSLWVGHKVCLRAVAPEDGPQFVADGLDTETARFGDDIKLPVSLASMQARIDRLAPKPAEQAASSGDNCWLAVEALDTGALVGSVTIHGTDPRHRCLEYGIAIFRQARRHGYAFEAVALALRYYFRELGYHRACATVYSFNTASLALQRRLGFVEEGLARESLFTHGQYYDEHLFGLLASEFGPTEQQLPPVPFSPHP